ncbi:MAG: tungsten ABC transporter substrate-binding protein [Dehalococcoidia bacterium SM23_28_2]|nr:MAG: tungsten ABC transporter substrate-binding protein [Dehalococcoidia bacterium SM23_28_2]
MRRWIWTGLLAVLAILAMVVVVGCGEEEETATQTPLAQATPVVTQTPQAEATATATPVERGPKEVILATTTSTQDSGLLDVLEPLFEDETDYNLKIIAVGTGQALAMGERGDADVLLVHAPSSEMKLIDSGAAINRQLVMHNDFIIVGSQDDPADIEGMTSADDAFAAIYDSEATFVSRGDDSGTHKKEMEIWQKAGLDPEGQSWYEQSGQGMGATLQIANQKDAYILTDRGTYLAQSENLDLVVLVEGDPIFFNVYHVMQVNPEGFDLVNGPGGAAFVDFMISDEVQAIIEDFGVDKFGQPLFIPDAGKDESELAPS